MGYSGEVNFITYSGYYGYRYLQPKGFLNNLNLNFNLNYSRRLESDLYRQFIFNFNFSLATKKFLAFGGEFQTAPFGTNDIYEPRVDQRYVKQPSYYNWRGWISTDYRKKMAVDINVDWNKYKEAGRGELQVEVSPRYRVSDKWKLFLNTMVALSDKEDGFVDLVEEDIIFGKRNRNTLVYSLESQYIFNSKMSLNLSFRHYYSEVAYSAFYELQKNGELQIDSSYSENKDTTYNNWNIDLRFSWWFAPGSQLSVLYRNNLENFRNEASLDFSKNFDYLFASPQLNSLSLRLTYYLDYNRIKNWTFSKEDRPEDSKRL